MGYFQALLTGNAETLSHLCILNAFTFYIYIYILTNNQKTQNLKEGLKKVENYETQFLCFGWWKTRASLSLKV